MAFELALDAIGLRHGTDKSSSAHGYLDLYERFFEPLRYAPISLLEVGVDTGASLRTWRDYFPKASIVGVDIRDMRAFAGDRIAIEIADQSKPEQLQAIARRHGSFDIVIEDGSHFWAHQILTLQTLLPFMKPGGFYVVEDLQTNFGAMGTHFGLGAPESCMDYLKRLADRRVADRKVGPGDEPDAILRGFANVEFALFAKHCAILRRQPSASSHPLLARAGARELPGPGCALLAHIGRVGDFVSRTSSVRSPRGGGIQGFELRPDEGHPLADALQVRARLQDGSWTGWASAGSFVGTRGRGEDLTGFAVRFGKARHPEECRLVGQFHRFNEPVIVAIGEDCVPADGRLAPLVGMQILL